MFPSNGYVLSLKSFAYEYVIDAFDTNRFDGHAVESAITDSSFFTPRKTTYFLSFYMIDVIVATRQPTIIDDFTRDTRYEVTKLIIKVVLLIIIFIFHL